jgi:hypothetical protein
MLQGIIAGWILILFMAALFVDENLRHAVPTILSVLLSVAVIIISILLPIVMDNKHKSKKTKKQVVEIEVVK